MRASSFFISPLELWSRIGTPCAPQIVDVRRRDIYESSRGVLPGSYWHSPSDRSALDQSLERSRPVVVACKLGHQLSQMTAATLRADGCDAQVLEGGYGGWEQAGLPLVDRVALAGLGAHRPSLWVTRRRPKIDRVACPWLISRFLDPSARILFVDPPEVMNVASETGAVPFDIDGVALSHDGALCTFDTMLKIFGLESEPHLARIASIVRGADTARLELAPEAAGLLAVSLGLSELAGDDDHGLLERGFAVYDALFAWARFAAQEQHNWPAQAA